MIRNLKVLGLALVAICAMSAMFASAASADFTAPPDTTLTGSELTQNKFTVTGQVVTCSDVVFHATTPENTNTFESITVSPRYTECKTAIGTNVNVTGFGHLADEAGKPKCGYILHTSGTSSLECQTGAEVTVDAGPCIVHIPAQHFATGVTYKNTATVKGPPHVAADVDIEFNVGGITGNHTDGFLCPFGSSGHNTEGVLEGSVTVKGETPAGVPVDISTDH